MTLKQKLLCALMKLNVTHAGRGDDNHRWSANDLATDLAGLLDDALFLETDKGGEVKDVGGLRHQPGVMLEPQKVTGEVEKLHLKIGYLEVDLDAVCHGKVIVDGTPFPVRKLVVTAEVGQVAKMEAERWLLPKAK